MLIGDEMGEEGFDFGGAHGGGVTQDIRCAQSRVVEADIALVPVNISLFGAIGVSAQANGFADTFDKVSTSSTYQLSASAVGEFFLWHVSFADEVTNRLTDFRLCDR